LEWRFSHRKKSFPMQKQNTDSVSMTKEEEELRNSELIAQMLMQDQLQDAYELAEENPYLDNYYEDKTSSRCFRKKSKGKQRNTPLEEDQDDDYIPQFIVQRAKRLNVIPKRTKQVSASNYCLSPSSFPSLTTTMTTIAVQSDHQQFSGSKESGNEASRETQVSDSLDVKKRKKREAKLKQPKAENNNFAAGKWTDQEEVLFLEALEKFGRDWEKCAQYVGTRDKNAFKSHAQKYFIKLWKKQLSLPIKVQESGSGHTLSGKPLDPNSGAALQYLGLKKKMINDKNTCKASNEHSSVNHNPSENEVPIVTEETLDSDAKRKKTDKRKPIRESDLPISEIISKEISYDQGSGRTSYAKDKLRVQNSILYWQKGDQEIDPLTMIRCSLYSGKPGSGLGAQPFKVEIKSSVLLVIDFHAHLATTEIIGFLAGKWDGDAKLINIEDAFPCQSLSTGEDAVNVEMDPQAELQIRDTIQQLGMRVVGWYHSHPTFQPVSVCCMPYLILLFVTLRTNPIISCFFEMKKSISSHSLVS